MAKISSFEFKKKVFKECPNCDGLGAYYHPNKDGWTFTAITCTNCNGYRGWMVDAPLAVKGP